MCVEKSNIKQAKCYKFFQLALIFVLAVVLLSVSGCSKLKRETIDINQYIVTELDGYDGYGSVVFDIDYEKMINEIQAADEVKSEVLEIAKYNELFIAEYQESDVLKNGDAMMVTWQTNQDAVKAVEKLLKIKFENNDYTHAVTGLEIVKEYNPFDDLCFDTKQTPSGKGEIEFSIHCWVNEQEITWDVAHSGENGTIKNGDILTLTIENDIDMEAFIRDTGLKITKTTDEHEVLYLGEYAVDQTILQRLSAKEEGIFNKVIEDWVVSGLNDEKLSAKDRTYEPYGYVFYTNANPNDESVLVAIYTIDDPYVPEDYYVFIGLKGVFSFDYNGVYINNGEDLPTSFIYYEKETVRYSEKFGWGQGDEPMGFLYNGAAYAGHMDVQETFEYLESTYGKDYSQRYASQWLEGVVPERE